MKEIVSAPEAGRTALAPRRRWRLRVGIALAALLLGAGGFLFWRNAQHWREREAALRLAEAGSFAEAEPLLVRAWQRYPRDWQVAKALALGYLTADKAAEAEPCVSRWCALQPRSAEPFKLRFELYQHLKRPEDAAADGLRVLELEPDNIRVCHHVVQLLWKSGRLAEMDDVFRRCLAENPDHPGLLYLHAEIHQLRGDNAQARAAVEDLLRLHPGHTNGIVFKAALLSDDGQTDEAITLLRGVLARSPESQTARYHLGVALTRAGKPEEARREMEQLQRYRDAEQLAKDSNGRPRDLELRVRAARALLDVGLGDQALELLRSAVADDPRLVAAHRLLADYYERHGQPAAAAEHRRLAGQTP
jgi:tetratricopeptide (TPR) repeat protein